MKRICKNGDSLIQGKYHLYNNLWGADTGSGAQCLWGASSNNGSHIGWGTHWSWTGANNSIKSFAAVVLGWHWGWRIANTGLPIQLSSIQSARTSWSFNLTQKTPGEINVTYDIWLGKKAKHNDENPTGEIMIWLYHSDNIHPIGSKQAREVIADTIWDLWQGPHPVSGWPVYSFVRKVNTNSDSLDLMDFFNYLFFHGLLKSDYLLSIEAGPEVINGTGRLDTTFYSVDIESIG